MLLFQVYIYILDVVKQRKMSKECRSDQTDGFAKRIRRDNITGSITLQDVRYFSSLRNVIKFNLLLKVSLHI